MLKIANESDKILWAKLNKEFMEFEIQDKNPWNNIEKIKEEELTKIFEEALENPEHITIFMIEEDGTDVGFANLMTIYSVWSKGRALIIDDLYLTPENRGRGLGKSAMKDIESYAKNKGYKRLQFMSEETNPDAKAFYTKIGYKPVEMNFYARYI